MTLKQHYAPAWRWIEIVLLVFGLSAEAESQTKTRVTDKTTVRQPEPAVVVTTEIHETKTRTVHENGQVETIKTGTQTKNRATDWHGELGETAWNGEAGRAVDNKVMTESRIGNIPSTRPLGSTRLKNGETLLKGAIGPEYTKTIKGDLGAIKLSANAGAKGFVNLGDNGIEAKGQFGIETELKASTPKLAVGDKTIGASLKGSVRLEASAIAKGRFGAYVDEKGITFGAEGSAGVYVKGEAKMNFEAHVFGVKTNVNLIASGYAGALAEGKAVVTLGWNGKVSFMASIGASLGFGGGLAVEFEMDAEELMKRLNLTDLTQLLAWMKAFQENPLPALTQLGFQAFRKLHEAGFGVVRKLGHDAARIFENKVMKPLQATGDKMKEGLGKGLAFLGRLIRSPKSETDNANIDACIQQVTDTHMSLPEGCVETKTLAFPLCLAGSANGVTGMEDWEGLDLYSWFPFDWPSAYVWPSL
jgi:hypothetical protein